MAPSAPFFAIMLPVKHKLYKYASSPLGGWGLLLKLDQSMQKFYTHGNSSNLVGKWIGKPILKVTRSYNPY